MKNFATQVSRVTQVPCATLAACARMAAAKVFGFGGVGAAGKKKARILMTEDANNSRSLFDLGPGERGRIRRIRRESAFRKRLLEMGFVSGAEVEKLKVAPLADPAEYVIKGYHVSLRKEEARDILVD